MKKLLILLMLTLSFSANAERLATGAEKAQYEKIMKQTEKCMRSASKIQQSKGVTMAGQAATYSAYKCGADIIEFLMNVDGWQPKEARDEILQMAYRLL